MLADIPRQFRLIPPQVLGVEDDEHGFTGRECFHCPQRRQIALRFDWDLAARVQAELREAGVEPAGIHRLGPVAASTPHA